MLIVTFRTLQFSLLGEVHNSFMTRERFHRYRRDKTLPLSSSFSLSLSLSLFLAFVRSIYEETRNFRPGSSFFTLLPSCHPFQRRSQCRSVTLRKLKSSNELDLVTSSKNHRDRRKLFPSLSFVSHNRRYISTWKKKKRIRTRSLAKMQNSLFLVGFYQILEF